MQDMALVESLKLLFNITHFCLDRVRVFSSSLQHILVLLSKVPISSSKLLSSPITPLINTLINLDLRTKDSIIVLFPKSTSTIYLDYFVELRDKLIKVYTDDELEYLVSPLLILLRVLYEVSPLDFKAQMRKLILLSSTDRL